MGSIISVITAPSRQAAKLGVSASYTVSYFDLKKSEG